VRIFLKPGEFYVGEEPAEISTILGSCVSVTIFSVRKGIGGMCHAQLPRNRSSRTSDRFRYVDSSIYSMLHEFEQMGVNRTEMVVNLLGGADVLESSLPISIGRKNIETALEIIAKENLYLARSDVGGKRGRKIHFDTRTGKILLKRLGSASPKGTP
jgi:chemotaxis protein CheD